MSRRGKIDTMAKQRHHIVQDKYLTQWRKTDTDNQLNIYVISENKIIERGPKWKGFWREDFNVLEDEQDKSFLPEDVTADIDRQGIEVIKNIDSINETQLESKARSILAAYISLQYIRTPRYREELDKMVNSTLKYYMRHDISSIDKVTTTKEELLKYEPKNDHEKKMLEEIKFLSEEEIRQQIFDGIHGDDFAGRLTKTGHSKGILKVDRLAEELFEVQWVFLSATQSSEFITSDNPCFTISPTKMMNGLLSPTSTVIFPLRPDLCIYIRPGVKSKAEQFMELDSRQLLDINRSILSNSYHCAIAKNRLQLEELVQNFDYENHRPLRDITITESGPYTDRKSVV